MYSRVFIIVDAPDECQGTSERQGTTECQATCDCRTEFLSEMISLQSKCEVNIFATSRSIPKITKIFIPDDTGKPIPEGIGRFEQCIPMEICATDGDVRSYLEGHMLALPEFVDRSPEEQEKLQKELQEEIKTQIVKAVGGMCVVPV